MKQLNVQEVATSKKEATEKGLSFYFTGKPCPKGHLSVRYRSGGCVLCAPRVGTENSRRKPPLKKPREFHFFKKVVKTDTCWLWIGLFDKDGYGKFSKFRAHRYSYELHFGEIPEGKQVCHSCDVRNCVNPEHLWLGDNTLNMRDRNKKDRQAKRHKIRPDSISGKTAFEAFMDIKNGMKLKEIAKKYAISAAQAFLIKNAKTWHFRVDS